MTKSANPQTAGRPRSWPRALVREDASIGEVIRNLDASTLQISLVVNDQGALLGTITDGDVRRALLRGADLRSQIQPIMHAAPLVVTPVMGKEVVRHLMRVNRIRQLPVVDEKRRVVGLHLWDELLEPFERPNTMVIMAGGFGRRLQPYTNDCPKPMLPVAGKPMLEHIIDRAKQNGFRRFVISTHYLGHRIRDYFGDGSAWGVHIDYVAETNPLGTAGSLSLIELQDNLPIVVTNGDVLTDADYGDLLDFHIHQQAQATMAVRPHEWQHPFGVVHTVGLDITGFEEKPVHRTHVNAGIYALDPQALDVLRSGEPCDMPTLFERLRQSGQSTIAYPMHESWMDVGRPEDLDKINSRGEIFSSGNPQSVSLNWH
jgi:dTDP-glucose pyrophosphorylase/predicted transcriptional regulator